MHETLGHVQATECRRISMVTENAQGVPCLGILQGSRDEANSLLDGAQILARSMELECNAFPTQQGEVSAFRCFGYHRVEQIERTVHVAHLLSKRGPIEVEQSPIIWLVRQTKSCLNGLLARIGIAESVGNEVKQEPSGHVG